MKTAFVTFVFALFLATSAMAQIAAQLVAGNLDQPVDIVQPPDGSNRLFIVLQSGKIVIFNGQRVLSTAFLNVSSLISCCGEQGLLSLAFHPKYKTNGLFYIYYTDTNGNIVLA